MKRIPIRGKPKPDKVNKKPHLHTHKKKKVPVQPYDLDLESDRIKLEEFSKNNIIPINDIPKEDEKVLTSDEKESILDYDKIKKSKRKRKSKKKKIEPTTIKEVELEKSTDN